MLRGYRVPSKFLEHHARVRNAPFLPRGAQKTPDLPQALRPHCRPPNGLKYPVIQICNPPDGQSNIRECTTGKDIQLVILPSVISSGACHVRTGTGNIPSPHGNGFVVLPTADVLTRGSPWRHQLHLRLGHFVISDAPQWPGIILDLRRTKGWNSKKELVKMDGNWQQILCVYGRIPPAIRLYTPEYTAVYPGWVGRNTAVYSRYTAVYLEHTAVHRGYTAVYTRNTAVLQDHGTGWVTGMHATLVHVTSLVQTPLPSNMQEHV